MTQTRRGADGQGIKGNIISKKERAKPGQMSWSNKVEQCHGEV